MQMIPNNSGGMGFTISDWDAFRRFLILGCESSCYQTSMTIQSLTCSCIERLLLHERGQDMIDEIVNISEQGRSAKQSYLLYALAKIATFSKELKCYIFRCVIKKVCRTFSTLTEFLSYFEKLSWGKNTREGLAVWMHSFSPMALAYQFTKYRNRHGFTPKDILRLTHIVPNTDEYNDLFKYITGKSTFDEPTSDLQKYIFHAHKIRYTTDVDDALRCIKQYKFTWEHIGYQKLLKDVRIWNAMLKEGLPYHALLKNLVRLSKLEELDVASVCNALCNHEHIVQQRVHPLQVLQAYRMLDIQDTKIKADDILSSLNDAYHASFINVEPIGKRFLLAVDVSGSMDCTRCIGMSCLSARDAVAALCMAIVKKEPFVHVVAFSDQLTKIHLHEDMSLHEVLQIMQQLPFSATDCSLPIEYAIEKRLCVDCFIVMTDNETNVNKEHPHVLLQKYRELVNPEAKMVVLATSATNITIADPQDPGMLDIAGMDNSVFHVLSEFCKSI